MIHICVAHSAPPRSRRAHDHEPAAADPIEPQSVARASSRTVGNCSHFGFRSDDLPNAYV